MRRGFSRRKKRATRQRNVENGPKRGVGETTDAHERGKNFVNDVEMKKLLEAAKRGRHGTRDYLSMLYRSSATTGTFPRALTTLESIGQQS